MRNESRQLLSARSLTVDHFTQWAVCSGHFLAQLLGSVTIQAWLKFPARKFSQAKVPWEILLLGVKILRSNKGPLLCKLQERPEFHGAVLSITTKIVIAIVFKCNYYIFHTG